MIHHYAKAHFDVKMAEKELAPAGKGPPGKGPLWEQTGTGRLEEILHKTAQAEGGTRKYVRTVGGVKTLVYDFAGDADGAEACADEWQDVARMAELEDHAFSSAVVAGEPYPETLINRP